MDGKPAVEDDPDAVSSVQRVLFYFKHLDGLLIACFISSQILEFTKKKKKKKPVNLDELIASQETPKQENEEKPNDGELWVMAYKNWSSCGLISPSAMFQHGVLWNGVENDGLGIMMQ